MVSIKNLDFLEVVCTNLKLFPHQDNLSHFVTFLTVSKSFLLEMRYNKMLIGQANCF